MRRTTSTTLHRTAVATATAAAAALLAAGCGAQHDGKGGGAPGSAGASSVGSAGGGPASPPASPSATPSAPASKASSGCTDQAQLGAADSGRTVCLTVGGYLRLTLDGTKDRPWTPVEATGTVLKGADPGIVILPGDALAAYTATAPGTARLTSSRPLCATGPHKISCKGIQEWTVTVRVTRP
ncbi:hypothetical protein [Streptomyces sp. MK7]|uniref:hypothetical protein n=1 Tax=Streptomyces sp. MK7 TaxID=3067635 RepID=UPI00292FB421|nr:hypothetical protein [Streptomyces sp. MK7]